MGEGRKTNGHSRPEDFLLPEFEEVELPSGLHAKLRPPSLDQWIMFGELPGRLHALAKAAQDGADLAQALPPEERLAWAHHVICWTFIEPKFSTSGEPGTFHPSRLRSEDRKFLIEWSSKFEQRGGGVGLDKFREQAGEPAGAGRSGEAVRESSK